MISNKKRTIKLSVAISNQINDAIKSKKQEIIIYDEQQLKPICKIDLFYQRYYHINEDGICLHEYENLICQ